MEISRFNRHADRLRERHGARVWRLGLDAGFGCPGRGLPGGLRGGAGGRGPGGCAFCSQAAGRAAYLGAAEGLAAQVAAGLDFLVRRYGASRFMLYFQAFSSTNAPAEELRRVYDLGIAEARAAVGEALVGLVVSTRPDCVDGERAALLASYARAGLEVWVELGVQSARESTLARLRRGQSAADSARARSLLGEAGLRTAAHLVLGLPGESRADMLASVDFAAERGFEGIKLHDLHLPRGSSLAREYLAGELTLVHHALLPALLADCLERLPPSCEVIRLGSDAGEGERLAPRRRPDKAALYRAVEGELAGRGSRQGARRP